MQPVGAEVRQASPELLPLTAVLSVVSNKVAGSNRGGGSKRQRGLAELEVESWEGADVRVSAATEDNWVQ